MKRHSYYFSPGFFRNREARLCESLSLIAVFFSDLIASNTQEKEEEEEIALNHMNTMKHGRKYIESHCLLLTENYARIEVGISYFVDVGNGRFQRTFLIFVFAVVFLN